VLKPEELPRAFDVLAGVNVGREWGESLVDGRAVASRFCAPGFARELRLPGASMRER
jgi:hypothetical protein